jgi:AcrR family transcriptional regulator
MSRVAEELPVIDVALETIERADAARNRAKILAAAEELFDRHGVQNVSIDQVARAANVGKGTIYRRFGDRGGLALSLLGEQERRLQDELIRGAPPTGPGAPPRERLRAFGERYLALLDRHAELLAEGESSPSWLGAAGPMGFYRTHLRLLLDQASPGCDAPLGAAVLLSTLSPRLFLSLSREQDVSLERMQDAWRRTVDGWLSQLPAAQAAIAGTG